MQNRKIIYSVLSLMLWAISPFAFGQKIVLKNPSFEDIPRHSTTPYGWYDCGTFNESPPDIQPGAFNVNKASQHRRTYIGLVTRDNDTWEGMSQRLSSPIKSGECYHFSMHLARSEDYISVSRTTRVEENFNKPVKVRIWGGNSFCNNKELLAQSRLVDHTDWRKYKFKFTAKGTYNYIFIEAFYKTPLLFAYNGNLLIDNCSTITPCDQPIEEAREEREDILASIRKPNQPPNRTKTEPITKPKTTTQPQEDRKTETTTTTTQTTRQPKPKNIPKPKILKELQASKVTLGKPILIEKLEFPADSFRIKKISYTVLNEIYNFMIANPRATIEVGGHTNGIPPHSYCDNLSRKRAKAIVLYLKEKGIDSNRLSYKGYGKRKPISTNETRSGRRKNQRVEIIVLSLS